MTALLWLWLSRPDNKKLTKLAPLAPAQKAGVFFPKLSGFAKEIIWLNSNVSILAMYMNS